jgi:2-C-methyl-D-erythritol 4-phosphate cytidylyltransferase/2-C-methyl-D-erythritol 2,4-cyclodiphosphate synthase
MIHDAARPFLSSAICNALIKETTVSRGAVPLLDSVDSLKELCDGKISALPREKIFRTQTPQAFNREALLDVLEKNGDGATDEATLWLDSSRELAVVPGDEKNFKITTDFDWQVALSLVNAAKEQRVGLGYDVHELVPGRRLVLGGVEIDSTLGLLGHSDADIVCHAMADALLGAAGEGDIGTLFPASDAAYRDADSTNLLEEVLALLGGKGWRVVWCDVTLVAQVPRLGVFVPKIIDHLSWRFKAFDLEGKLNLKVKSGEYVGSAGRGECMTCHAVATIERLRLRF